MSVPDELDGVAAERTPEKSDRDAAGLSPVEQEAILGEGALGIVGRVVDSSNATFVVEVSTETAYTWAIYKPLSGERPLWDFEPGLYKRERAAYVVDQALGWGLVPPTVIRPDCPLGVGSLQWFIETDPAMHYFRLAREEPDTHPDLRRLATFDAVTNNTDRKGGHVLLDQSRRVWGIDHGLCFAAPFKLRTVIWDFAGEQIEPDTLADLARLGDDLPDELSGLLDETEVRALRRRIDRLTLAGVLPIDQTGRAWPWPLI